MITGVEKVELAISLASVKHRAQQSCKSNDYLNQMLNKMNSNRKKE